MLGKAPICKLSRSKAPKRRKLAVTDIRQKPVDIFNNTTRARTLALAIIFQNSGSFAKVSVPVTIYNSLHTGSVYWELWYYYHIHTGSVYWEL